MSGSNTFSEAGESTGWVSGFKAPSEAVPLLLTPLAACYGRAAQSVERSRLTTGSGRSPGKGDVGVPSGSAGIKLYGLWSRGLEAGCSYTEPRGRVSGHLLR